MSNTADNGTPLPAVGDGESGDGLVREEEFIGIKKSHMDELMNHTRLQTESMTNMIQMMKGMQGEIKQLTKKCNGMEKIIQRTQSKVHHVQTTMQQTYTDKCEGVEQSISTMQDRIEKSMWNQTNHTNNVLEELSKKCNKIENSMQKNQNTNSLAIMKSLQKMKKNENTLSSTMKSRFGDVEDRLKYHEVLLKNQKWEYSAPRPSEEFWDNIDPEAEDFLEEMKNKTNEMRYGHGHGHISIDARPELDYDYEFRPHWKEFTNALKQYNHFLKYLPGDEKSRLSLRGMEIPPNVINLLSDALKSTHFHQFALQNNNFGQNGIDFALNYLQKNGILEDFTLQDNPIDNMRDIKRLCQTVKKHPSIKHLTLDGCKGESIDGNKMLQMVMNAGRNKLISVDLCTNRITDGTFISDFLSSNTILETLELTHNNLNDNDAKMIAGALKHNTTLRTLDIRYNNRMTKSGWMTLRNAIFDDTSLNAAANSNHTCCVDFPSINDDDEDQFQEVIEMNDSGDSEYYFDTKYVRQKKVYSILSSRNRNCCNAEYLEDVPFELLPDMLISIQQYSKYHVRENTPIRNSGDVKPLSIVYEICRYWDESLAAYESLST